MSERVKEIKLPFKLISPNPMKKELMPNVESKGVKRLKKEVDKLKRRNVGMNNDL